VSSPSTIKSSVRGEAAPAAFTPQIDKPTSPRPARRKAVCSVGPDGLPRSWQDISPASPPASGLGTFQRAVLPQPSVRGRRLQLANDVLADFAVIFCAVWTVSRLQGVLWGTRLLQTQSGRFGSSLFQQAIVYGIFFTLFGYSERLYQVATMQSAAVERVILGKCVAWSALIAGLMSERFGVLQLATVAAFALFTYFFLLARRGARRWLSAHRGQTPDVRNVLIVGAGSVGQKLADHLERSPLEKRMVLGFLDDHHPVGGNIRGRVRDLSLLAQTEFVDEIILAGVPRETAQQAIWEARRCGIGIKLVPELISSGSEPLIVEQLGDMPVLTLRQERIPPFGLALKRGFDILGSAVGLVLAGPFLGLIALAIGLDSPGPLLYKAPRAGFKGRRFTCYKFRTMVADADAKKPELRLRNERRGPFFKIQNDPRITRVGRFLRRYSLDELPQLWNVLRGEMSLVGPRPHPLDDFARYRIQDLKRLRALPGLTGLWQVTARQDPSFERNLMLDREYIEHWSLASDFKILFKTIAAVFEGSGS